MRDLMLNHGLDQPLLGIDTGYFQVTFPGPGDDIDRIRVPETRLVVTPAVEALLNDRQKRILAHVLEAGEVTSGWCVKQFGIAYDTASRDLKALAKMKVLVRTGHRKASKYILPEKQTRD
jgi:predicted HTH transcriptional regulator